MKQSKSSNSINLARLRAKFVSINQRLGCNISNKSEKFLLEYSIFEQYCVQLNELLLQKKNCLNLTTEFY